MITEELKKLYIAHTGHEPEQIDELPSSGSNRRYFRLIGSPTLIGVSGESVEENRAFLYMAEHLSLIHILPVLPLRCRYAFLHRRTASRIRAIPG